jgi:hypothetical protein
VDNCAFSANLVVWEPGDIRTFTHVTPGVVAEDVMFLDQNLWWSSDLAEKLPRLGAFPGRIQRPQLTTVDPRLRHGRPTAPEASRFGASGPFIVAGD